MISDIKGKVLIFSDQHFGLKGNSENKLKIAIQSFKDVIAYVKKNNIKYVISAGDIFHSRTSIDVNVINVAYKCISALAKYCNIYLICGNHDSYLKNSIDVNSINIFQDIENVTLVNSVTNLKVNNKDILLVPWLGDISNMDKETYDCIIGHFEISSQYLMKSYIEEHSKNNVNLSSEIDNDSFFSNTKKNSNDLVGDFIEIVRKNGLVFAGHIHTRKEFIAKGRKFIFIGSPYQQNLGEKDNRCGFYVLNEDMTYNFTEITSTPKHVDVRISDIINNFDCYDFSKIKGNIIHKIYDIEIDSTLDQKISQRIQDMKPFEEMLPDFEVSINEKENDENLNDSIELLKKSKLEYISNYIDNIDQKALDDMMLERKKLFEVLEKYYNEVI